MKLTPVSTCSNMERLSQLNSEQMETIVKKQRSTLKNKQIPQITYCYWKQTQPKKMKIRWLTKPKVLLSSTTEILISEIHEMSIVLTV